jgi:hypothetical protein
MRKLHRSVVWSGQSPVGAVHVGRGEIVWQDRCDAANGSKEPFLPIRRVAANGSFWPFVSEKSDSGATDMHLPPSFTDAFRMELKTAAALAS